MSISVEELIFKTKSLIYLAEKEKLLDVAKHLGLDESKIGEQAQWDLVKEIEGIFDKEVEKGIDQKKKQEFVSELLDILLNKIPALEGEKAEEEQVSLPELQNEREKLKKKQQADLEEALQKVEVAKVNAVAKGQDVNSGQDMKGDQSNIDHLKTILKRELRITGTISAPGQKDQVSFISLNRQIEAALAKGYTVREIVDAVIRSISPILPLRSYLEAISEINLPTLCRIIRAHYQEKNSSELYAELANLVQSPNEEPQTFLIRALNLREKVIYASKEEHSKLKYDSEHVQSMFLHTIETGLISNTLRGRIRPLLQDITITDEELISQLNVAITEEAEQSKKLASNVKVKAKVTQVEQAQPKPSEKPQKAQEAEMLNEMRALKAKVAVLEQEVKESQVKQKNSRPNRNSSKGSRFQGNRRGCSSCASSGIGDSCRHCWKCGSDAHFSFNCPERKSQNSGNGQCLLRRDPR